MNKKIKLPKMKEEKEVKTKLDRRYDDRETRVPPTGMQTISLQKGVTVEVEKFQFVRIDAGIVRNVPEDSDFEEETDKMSEMLDTYIEKEVSKL